jgi:hypothetical protein
MALLKGTVTVDPLTGSVGASTGLAGRIFDGLDSRMDYQGVIGPGLGTAKQQLADLAEVIAGAVIDEFVQNAQVASTVTVTSVSGVVAGPGTSGPGTGSATGTIT